MSTPNAIDWFPPRWLETPPGDLLAAPNVAELLAHLRAELERVRANFDRLDGREAEHFAGSIDAAAHALEAGDPAVLALRFFLLGMGAKALSGPYRPSELIGLEMTAYREKVRTLPLELRNARQQAARDAVQALARSLWAQEEHRGTRLADMCELVWARILDDGGAMLGSLPNSAAGLKPWLRPVAPAAARKAGAPRK